MRRRRPLRAAALALTLLAATAGPAAAGDKPPVRSLLELRQERVVIQQWDNSCGAAALATVLRHQFGEKVTERQVAQGMLRRTDPLRVRHRGGFSLLDLKRYAEARGFAADGYGELAPGDLPVLAPLIVPMRSRAGDHFVVVRGIAGGRVVLADPAVGNRMLPLPVFAAAWKDGIGFVVTPPGEPAVNRMAPGPADLVVPGAAAVRAALVPAVR
ncbi:MAG TPA: C39 family peptidase [Acetobacteraceae bacterium]|nr:C39 family peptidase [Acetobacteraceae bacterium]